jgi:hypothetical protein
MTPDFRYAGLWQWNPVSCVTPRSYDEKAMMRGNAWFFDLALMGRVFDAMREAGLNTWILANTHPFPFMVDLKAFPDAVVLSAGELARYQAHYHRLFELARAKGLLPFVLFHTCYVPDAFGKKHGIRPRHSFEPPPLAVEYTRHCVRELCVEYPELAGLNGEASENVAAANRAAFARQAIVEGIHDSGRRPVLFFRGWISDPVQMREEVQSAYAGECFFTVKYTWEFLVNSRPDPEFRRWVAACGAARILPEFWISNYQPFGCHDLELAAGIRRELQSLGCPGFTSHPMDLYGAPFVQGGGGVLQLERDRDWYATLSGAWRDGSPERARAFGLPDDEAALSAAAKAACRPLQLISYYLTGNKQNFLQPQWFAHISGSPERRAGLHTLDQWSGLAELADRSFGRWREQIDGLPVRYPGETKDGYGLENLLEELAILDAEPAESPHDAPLRAEAYAAWRRDVLALRCLARAWRERGRAVLAHLAGRSEEMAAALGRSLAAVRELPGLVGHDEPYRLLVGRHVVMLRWSDLIAALEEELADHLAGRPQPHYFFGQAQHYDQYGLDFAQKEK